MGEAHQRMRYPHALNRHDVGWETAETDANQRHSQPVSQPRQRSSDHHHDNKKKRGPRERETRTPRWKRNLGTGPPGDATCNARDTEIPYLIWRVSPASHLTSAHPSIHPPTLGPIFWRCTQWRRRQPTNWPMPTPPSSPPPKEKKKNQPSSGAYQHKPPIHTHPPGTAFDTEKGVA